MLKLGISTLEQIKDKKSLKTFFGSDKRISISLYQYIQECPDADEISERILLLFSDERGAYKRTYQKRFEIFDKKVIDIIKEIFMSSETLLCHDVAVSDGRTALDFFEKLSAEFAQLQYTASDYNPKVYLLEKGRTKVTISHTGKVLEVLFSSFVFNKTKPDAFRYYPLNHLILFFVELFAVRPLMKQYRQGLIQARELLLFAPQVLRRAQADNRFRLGQHDLLNPLEKQVHVIRAMNVLNPSYFSKSEFMVVVRNLYNGLKEGGILITGSNQDAGSIVNGNIYQKRGDGFQNILQSGTGSPIQKLILTFKP